MKKFIIFILFYVSAIQSQSLYRYEIIVDHLELPKKDELFDFETLRVKKYNRTTYVVNGHMNFEKQFSDDLKGRFELCAYQGNEYRKIGEKNVDKLCSFLRDDKMVVAKVIEKTSMASVPISCPIEPVRLHFYDASMPNDFLPVQLPNGEKYRLDSTFSLDGRTMSNFSIYFLLKKIVDEGIPSGAPKLG